MADRSKQGIAAELSAIVLAQARANTSGAAAIPASAPPIRSADRLGSFVAARRKALRLSQQEIADLAGVGRRFISELEAGKPTAEIGKILNVLQALGIDLTLRER